MTDTATEIIVDRGPVSTITLNCPARHNAISTPMGTEVVDALADLGADPVVKAIILAGAGKSFCSGDDISEADRYHTFESEYTDLLKHPYFRLVSAIRRTPRPVIAQVHGNCLAAGLDLMLACDYAYVASDARLHVLFGRIGVYGGTSLLPRYVGLKRATELYFADGPIAPELALSYGMVTGVVEADQLADVVRREAERLAESPARGFWGLVKEGINRSLYPDLEESVRTQALLTKLVDAHGTAW